MNDTKIDKFVSEIVKQQSKSAAHLTTGRVLATSGTTLSLVLAGDTVNNATPTKALSSCTDCKKGDLVLVIYEGTRYYAVGKL